MSGFRFDVSEKGAAALIASGWRVGPEFDADCGCCGGEGEHAGEGPWACGATSERNQCSCGGLLWAPPVEEGFPREWDWRCGACGAFGGAFLDAPAAMVDAARHATEHHEEEVRSQPGFITANFAVRNIREGPWPEEGVA